LSEAERAVLMVHGVHGAGGGGWEWRVWAGVFAAAGWRVHAPDLQPVADGLAATRLSDYRRQVEVGLAALPRPRALAGASLGGLLALQCAHAADALVLVNPMLPAPWHAAMAPRAPAPLVPWRARASLGGTRAALPDAGDADALYAFRHWRDESGAVLSEALGGVAIDAVACPCRIVVSARDADIAPEAVRDFARALGASVHDVDASHVGPLFGAGAAAVATATLTWLNVNCASRKFSHV
jgi:esterase/lipase